MKPIRAAVVQTDPVFGEVTANLECGIALVGSEVKSLRAGHVSIEDAYARTRDGELWMHGCDIQEYSYANRMNHLPKRTRKLLLHKKELAKILEATSQKGLTCVCTQLYWKAHLIKARIALASGKKAHDKRDTEKDRDWNRQKQRIVRENVKQ